MARKKKDYSGLRVSVTPKAIREAFEPDRDPDDPKHEARCNWVARMTDDELAEMGHRFLDNDRLWILFHELLEEDVDDLIREELGKVKAIF